MPVVIVIAIVVVICLPISVASVYGVEKAIKLISNNTPTAKRNAYLDAYQCKGITKAGYQCSAIVVDNGETTCKRHRSQSL
jgi:hypothetical protein